MFAPKSFITEEKKKDQANLESYRMEYFSLCFFGADGECTKSGRIMNLVDRMLSYEASVENLYTPAIVSEIP